MTILLRCILFSVGMLIYCHCLENKIRDFKIIKSLSPKAHTEPVLKLNLLNNFQLYQQKVLLFMLKYIQMCGSIFIFGMLMSIVMLHANNINYINCLSLK